MISIAVDKLKLIYEFDTNVQEAVEDWIINVLNLKYSDVEFFVSLTQEESDFRFTDRFYKKYKSWRVVFVCVRVSNGDNVDCVSGYTYTIKEHNMGLKLQKILKLHMKTDGDVLEDFYEKRFLFHGKILDEFNYFCKKYPKDTCINLFLTLVGPMRNGVKEEE